MTPELIPIDPATRDALFELAARTGRPPADLLAAAVDDYSRRFPRAGVPRPVEHIPGVNPADVWEAAAEADAGRLTPHDEVFARLRERP